MSLYVKTTVSQCKLDQLRRATTDDKQLQMAIQFTQQGWPRYAQNIPLGLGPLFEAHHRLSIAEDLVLYNDRIVVSRSMQQEILSRIHDGHPEVVKLRECENVSLVARAE